VRHVIGLAVIAAIFAFTGAAAGGTFSIDDALLVATGHTGATTVELISLDNGSMADVELDIPAGYTLAVGQPPGTKVADALAVNMATNLGQGTLTAADPAAYTDAASVACDPQTHVAVWSMSLTGLGSAPVTVPWFVDAGASGGYAAHICLPAATFGGVPGASALAAVILTFDPAALQVPAAPAMYLWRALIAAFGSDGATPNPVADLEYQAHVPLPTTLTMKGKYNAHTKSATMSGLLLIAGKPANGYTIDIGAATKPKGKVADVGTASTGANGRFNYPVFLSKSTYIFATPEPSSPPCTSPTTVACFATEYPVASVTAHVVVPKPVKKKKKPKR
jgi:hypothetical protein